VANPARRLEVSVELEVRGPTGGGRGGASSPSVSVPAFQPGRTVQALRILRAAIEMSNTRARHRLVRKRALTVFPTLIQMVAHAAMDSARDSALVGPPRLPPEA